MKPTGVIRRIDELGRIVVPKEIRKNLRIREGDSLEIYIDENENIIFKKYSVLKSIKDFANILVESIYGDIKRSIIITDTDKVLSAAGPNKKEYIGKDVSAKLVESITRRESMVEKHSKPFMISDKEEEMTYALSTIIAGGDAVGMVMIFDKDGVVGEVEEKIVKVISNFLAKHVAE